MTFVRVQRRSTDRTVDASVLEVATVSSDAMRAIVRVTGVLTDDTVSVLVSALGTHLRAGRRDLRVDLAARRAGRAQGPAESRRTSTPPPQGWAVCWSSITRPRTCACAH